MSIEIPVYPEDVSAIFLSELVGELRPGVTVEAVDVLAVRGYGDADTSHSVSTSTQVSFEVRYGGAAHEELPTRLLAKMPIPNEVECANPELGPLFENEVEFYRRLRPELDGIEAPLGLGGRFDQESGRYMLLMEDITVRSPHINSMMDPDNIPGVEAILDTYAKLHARNWCSPRFETDLSWVQGQVEGSMEDMFDRFIRDHVVNELARENYKREFAEEAGATEAGMYFAEKALKRHHAKLPQTFLHGDGHIGNTYVLPDGTGGLFDFQVCCRGYFMFDVAYLLHTGLSVDMRRRKERDLLAMYLDRLQSHGVRDAPDMVTVWNEYRLMALHSFYLGWLTAPRENYGLEVCVIGNHRTKTAFQDLETLKLMQDLL
ncbi:MAG: aminoglycoside phosphotransferase family protein [Halieaceae bacterium]|nr:aminoglycoside phosphotransferase family protein [Halieaceae bacterium]